MSALILVMVVEVQGSGPGLIARELALDFGDPSLAPSTSQCIPGITNGVSDTLSRRCSTKRVLP